MADCSHCGGTGRCQDDFHSGGGLVGGEDQYGQDHPGLLGSMFGSCPSCGGGNTEWRPECPQCDGTGSTNPASAAKRSYYGLGESPKERQFRERRSSETTETSSDSEGDSTGWLEELVILLLWLGRELADPDWHPAIRLVIVWLTPASFAYGIIWYVFEVYRTFSVNFFEGFAAMFLAWLVIPICLIGGVVVTVVLWGLTKLGYMYLNKGQEDHR